MSNNVDRKVVEMQFENKQFERDIKQSSNSLDKFKEKLNMQEAAKSTSAIQNMLSKIDFSRLADGVEQISQRFTNFGVVGTAALQKIATQAVEVGERLVKSLTIDQIMSGYEKMDQLTTATQTLRANGYEMERIEKELDKLMFFSDETSYSFNDMTSNLAKFTSQGLELEKSATALRGVATWAAAAGQNSQTASRAMYNISQALGAGAMKVADWKSIELANMATAEFKELALEAAAAVGTLTKRNGKYYQQTVKEKEVTKKDAKGKTVRDAFGNAVKEIKRETKETEVTIANFRETLKDGWFDNDTMMRVFNRYGAYADLVQQIKDTFDLDSSNQSMSLIEELSNVKPVDGQSYYGLRAQILLSRGYVETLDEAEKLLQGLDFSAAYDEVSKKAYQAAQEAKTFNEAIDATKDAVSSGWMRTFKYIFGNYEQQKTLWTDVANRLWDIFAEGGDKRNGVLKEWAKTGTSDVAKMITDLLDIIYNFKTEAIKAFTSIFGELDASQLSAFTRNLSEFISGIKEFTEDAEKMKPVNDIFTGIASAFKIVYEIAKGIASIGKTVWETLFPGTSFLDTLAVVGRFFTDLYKKIKENGYITTVVSGLKSGITSFGEAIREAFSGGIKEKANKFISMADEFIGRFSNIDFRSILLTIGGIVAGLKTLKVIGGVGNIVDSIQEGIGGIFDLIFGKTDPISASKLIGFAAMAAGIGVAIKSISEAIAALGALPSDKLLSGSLVVLIEFGAVVVTMFGILKAVNRVKLTNVVKTVGIIRGVIGPISDLISKIGTAVSSIAQFDPSKQATAFVGVTAMIYSLLGFLAILQKIKVDSAKLAAVSFGFTILSFAINNISKSVVTLGSLDIKSLAKGIGGVGFLLLELSAFMKRTTNIKNSLASAIGLVAVGISMKAFAVSIAFIGSMPVGAILKGTIGLGAILAELVLFLRLTKNVKSSFKMMLGLVAVSMALKSFAVSLAFLGALSGSSMLKGIVGLGAVLAEIVMFLQLTKKVKNSFKTMLGLAVASAALKNFVVSLAFLSSISASSLLKGILSLGAVLIEIILFLQLTKNVKNSFKTMLGLAAVGLALRNFSDAVSFLGALKVSSLVAGLAGLSAVLLEIILFLQLTKKVKNSFKTMLGLAVVGLFIKSFVTSIEFLGSISFSTLLKGILGLGAVLSEIVLFLHMTKKIKNSFAAMLGLGVVALSLKTFVVSLAFLGNLNAEQLMRGMLGLVSVLGMLLLFSKTLGTAKTSIPTIATTLLMLVTVALTMGAFALAINAIKNVNYKKVSAFGIGFAAVVGAIALTIGILGKIKFTAALKALASFSVFTVGMIAVVAGLGALATISPNLIPMLEKGAEVFSALGGVIGSFFGGIGGGAVKAFDDQKYSKFGEELSKYGDEISGISKTVSGSDMQTAKTLGNDLADIYNKTNTIPNAIANIINSWSGSGPVTLGGVSTDYGDFGKHLKEYAVSINGIASSASEKDFAVATEISKTLTAAQQGLNTIPGAINKLIAGWLSGDVKNVDSLDSVSTDYGTFGTHLKEYAKSISGIAGKASRADFDRAVEISDALTAAQQGLNTIPGAINKLIAGWLSGDVKNVDSLDSVSTDYGTFGTHLQEYAKSISGIAGKASKADFDRAVEISDALTAAQQGLNTIPGAINKLIAGWLSGDVKNVDSLDSVSTDYGTFGTHLKEYAKSISGIAGKASKADFDRAVEISDALTAAQQGLNTIPGAINKLIAGWLSGDVKNVDSLDSVSTDYGTFGTHLQEYAKSISGIAGKASKADFDRAVEISGALTAAQQGLNTIPGAVNKLISGWLLGDVKNVDSLDSVSTDYGTFGTHLKEYAKSIKGIASAASASDFEKAKEVSDLLIAAAKANQVPVSVASVISAWFGNTYDQDTLDTASADYKKFGEHLKEYAVAISGISSAANKGDFTSAIKIADDLQSFVDRLRPSGTLWDSLNEVFGTGSKTKTLVSLSGVMAQFGTDLKNLFTSLDSIQGAEGKFVSAKTMFDEFAAFVKEQSGSGSLWSSLGDIFGEGSKVKTVLDYADSMRKFGEALAGFSEGLTAADEIKIAGDVQNKLLNDVGPMVEAFEQFTVEYGAVKNAGKNFSTMAVDLGNLGDGLSRFYSAFAGHENFGSLKNIGETLQSIVEAAYYASMLYDPEQAVQNMIDLLFAYSDSKLPDTAKTFMDGVVGALDDESFYSRMMAIGSSLVDGLADGISSNDAAINAIRDLAEQLEMTVRVETETHSPSKVFERIGGYLMDGFALGIRDKAYEPIQEMTKAVSGLLDPTGGLGGLGGGAFSDGSSPFGGISGFGDTLWNNLGGVFGNYGRSYDSMSDSYEEMSKSFDNMSRAYSRTVKSTEEQKPVLEQVVKEVSAVSDSTEEVAKAVAEPSRSTENPFKHTGNHKWSSTPTKEWQLRYATYAEQKKHGYPTDNSWKSTPGIVRTYRADGTLAGTAVEDYRGAVYHQRQDGSVYAVDKMGNSLVPVQDSADKARIAFEHLNDTLSGTASASAEAASRAADQAKPGNQNETDKGVTDAVTKLNKDVTDGLGTMARELVNEVGDLGDSMRSLSIVLDDGTLVGKLLPAIDRGLGIMMAKKNRMNISPT